MKVTINGWMHLETGRWIENGQRYSFWIENMSNVSDEHHQYIPICEHSFEVEIPDDFDPRPQLVASLREQKQKILADAHVKAEAIEERIQQVLCLENKEGA